MLGTEKLVFIMMLDSASSDLFMWYCTRYNALRGHTEFEGVTGHLIHGSSKIMWMASTKEWQRDFWMNWFRNAAGLLSTGAPNPPCVRNSDVAYWIVKWVFNGQIPCTDACYRLSNSTAIKDIDTHDRLREFCTCRSDDDAQGHAKRVKMPMDQDGRGSGE